MKRWIWLGLIIVTVTMVAAQCGSSATPTATITSATATPEPATATPEAQRPETAMVLIPAGAFEMGSDQGEADEQPAHTVTLDDYYIDQYEVTNAQYAACVESGDCQPPAESGSETRLTYFGDPEYDEYPAVYITWSAAQNYCQWRGARLPTEAEWERAARGTADHLFPWGDTLSAKHVNYCDNNCTLPWADPDPEHNDGYKDTAPVGSYPAGVSPYEVHDLAGNVWEWVSDWYAPDYYSVAPAQNPTGPTSGTQHVTRGGGWVNDSFYLRTTARRRFTPNVPSSSTGFRCANTP